MMASLLQVESRDELGISVLTPAKINLWLEVLGKRDDGFHEIVSLMQPVGWYDHLSFQFSKTRDDLKVQGGAAPEDSTNLVMKALHQARRSRDIDPVHIVLKKSIPAEAGLGGGSSNAAATLACLHEWAPDPRGWAGVLMDARSLGSDIPFFLGEGPAVVRGRGELLEPISQPLFGNTEMYACIWKPDFGLVYDKFREFTFHQKTIPISSKKPTQNTFCTPNSDARGVTINYARFWSFQIIPNNSKDFYPLY